MELRRAGTNSVDHTGFNNHDRIVEQRLEHLLELNADTARNKDLYRTERERIDASLMTSPIDSRKAFSYFGLMIGTLPTFALVLKIAGEALPSNHLPIGFLMLLGIAGVATGIVGYASGRYVPMALAYAAKLRSPNNILLLPFIGILWGGVSGAIGGLFLFVVGSIFAGIAGAMIGALALPLFVALHWIMRRGELIEMKYFMPLAFGITLTIGAFILGL